MQYIGNEEFEFYKSNGERIVLSKEDVLEIFSEVDDKSNGHCDNSFFDIREEARDTRLLKRGRK